MVIGIDLDNTIIDYNDAFRYAALKLKFLTKDWINTNLLESSGCSKKSLIKKHILSLNECDYKWESLQGQVYGRYLHYAQIFPGVANFLLHCYRRGETVRIISHKTDFGHHDNSKTPLRKAALSFLEQNSLLRGDFGITSEDIYFFDSRKKKVSKIAELNCNYFIDDLPEVFEEPGFPENTKKILLDIQSEHACAYAVKSWREINESVFSQIEESDIAAYAEMGVKKKVKSVKKIKGRGNSNVYKIGMKSGQDYAGKYYPDPTFDDRDRLLKETSAYKFLHSNEIKLVPESIWSDTNLNFGLFEWIKGVEISQVIDAHINYAADFVVSLAKLSKQTSYNKFHLASAACLSGQMAEEQIRNRYATIYKFSDIDFGLRRFLEKDFSQLFEEILSESKKTWPGDFDKDLANDYQLLSPSDFGFHNTLLTKDGLMFFDFEYFGWDDPVKLSCDFMLHPGMTLTVEQKKLWSREMKEIFSEDMSFSQRLAGSYCLYGLCWCLIHLNVFSASERKKKNLATAIKDDHEKKQAVQLIKSNELLEHLKEVCKFGFPYE